MKLFGYHFVIWCGRDWLRGPGYWLFSFYAFRRKAQQGELQWRLCLDWQVLPDPFQIFTCHRFWPAWRDEPSALAEYERTMRGR
jgi:hypothetical protein